MIENSLIKIKPLSVNVCWQGKRFKTPKYKAYESQVYLMLPNIVIPDGDLKLNMTIGVSTKAADLDNTAKPFIDILQKKYDFNDSRIYQLVMIKDIVKKGDEYIDFYIEPY